MTQPAAISGRPHLPPPGAPAVELRIARIRSWAGWLVFPAVVLIAVAAAGGFFYNNVQPPLQNWMLLTLGAVTIFLLVFLPWLAWRRHVYTITTRRVIEQAGVFQRQYRELGHEQGYSITERRGIFGRMVGTGTLTLVDAEGSRIRLRRIAHVGLVHETLVDQVEINQILAHRDGRPAGDVPAR